MIIAAITALFLMFGSGNWWTNDIESVEKVVKQTLPVGEQRESVLATLNAQKDAVEAEGKAQKKAEERFREVLEDHGGDEAELRKLLSEYRSDSVGFFRELAKQRMALKQELTEEQWRKIYGAVAVKE